MVRAITQNPSRTLRPWREETRDSRYGRRGRYVNSKPYLYFPASEILCVFTPTRVGALRPWREIAPLKTELIL